MSGRHVNKLSACELHGERGVARLSGARRCVARRGVARRTPFRGCCCCWWSKSGSVLPLCITTRRYGSQGFWAHLAAHLRPASAHSATPRHATPRRSMTVTPHALLLLTDKAPYPVCGTPRRLPEKTETSRATGNEKESTRERGGTVRTGLGVVCGPTAATAARPACRRAHWGCERNAARHQRELRLPADAVSSCRRGRGHAADQVAESALPRDQQNFFKIIFILCAEGKCNTTNWPAMSSNRVKISSFSYGKLTRFPRIMRQIPRKGKQHLKLHAPSWNLFFSNGRLKWTN